MDEDVHEISKPERQHYQDRSLGLRADRPNVPRTATAAALTRQTISLPASGGNESSEITHANPALPKHLVPRHSTII